MALYYSTYTDIRILYRLTFVEVRTVRYLYDTKGLIL